jgi:hypothetical protein
VVGHFGEGIERDGPEVLGKCLCNHGKTACTLNREARIANQRRDLGVRCLQEAMPPWQRRFQAVINAFVARPSRHLRQEDEDELVEWIVLIIQPRRAVDVLQYGRR